MLGASSREPWGKRARGGLLGHAVVADDGVKAPTAVAVLGSVIGLQRGRDAAFVLVHKAVRAGVVIGEGFVHHQEHYAGQEG